VSLIGSCGARPTFLSDIFFLRYLNFCSPSLSFTLRPFITTMADTRSDSEGGSRAKRQKTDADPKNNPYLAHMYENENGSENSAFAKFKRHQTTSALAKKAEDGEINPFSGRPFSSKYFSILKTRRDLPVHQQR
jgi:pre-mRNA-splicing factor ATP-dependent RNA helicase DHX15/PRP43